MATKAKKTKKERIKFTGLEVENFQRITLAKLEFSGEPGVIEVTGNNKAGKTSLRDAGVALLGGRGEIRDDPRNDETKGQSRVLGMFSNGFRILLRPTPSNPKGNLVIEGPDGGKYNQTFLNAWVGEGTFDLGGLREYQSRPEKLVPILLSLGKDPTLPTQLKEIQSERATLENQRSPWISGKQRAERTNRPEGERSEAVDVSGEMEKLTELERQRAVRNTALGKADEVLMASQAKDREADALEREIEDLEARLADRQQLRLDRRVEACDLSQAASEQNSDACALPYDEEGIQATRARLAEADEINRALEPWKEWDRAQAEIEEARMRISGYNKDLEGLRDQERTLLKEKGPDLPGLSFDEEGLPLLWDRGLEKASGGQWLEFSAAVAFAHDSELGVAFFDEAEGLDDDRLRDLHKLGQEWDFQLFLYKLRASGVGEVVICEDGKAWNQESENED